MSMNYTNVLLDSIDEEVWNRFISIQVFWRQSSNVFSIGYLRQTFACMKNPT